MAHLTFKERLTSHLGDSSCSHCSVCHHFLETHISSDLLLKTLFWPSKGGIYYYNRGALLEILTEEWLSISWTYMGDLKATCSCSTSVSPGQPHLLSCCTVSFSFVWFSWRVELLTTPPCSTSLVVTTNIWIYYILKTQKDSARSCDDEAKHGSMNCRPSFGCIVLIWGLNWSKLWFKGKRDW